MTFKENKKKDSISNLKKLYPFVKPYRFRLIASSVAIMIVGALDGAIAYSLKPFMDSVMVDKAIDSAWIIPLAIIGFSIIQGAFNYIGSYLNTWVGMRLTNDIKRTLFSKMLMFETEYFDSTRSGHILTRFSNDPAVVTNLLETLKTLTVKFFSVLFLSIVLIFNSWQLAIIAIVVLLTTFYPMSRIRKNIKNADGGVIKTQGVINSVYNESFAANKIISLYNLQDYQTSYFNSNLNKVFGFAISMAKRRSILTPVMRTISSFGVALVIWYGSHLILTEQITGGTLASFIVALIMLYNPIKGLGPTLISINGMLLALDRMVQLLDYEPKIKNAPNAIKINGVREKIEFENVFFKYKKSEVILKNINLTINVGETIAIVGNSGGGKTTFVNLLPRLYDPFEGRITIDGTDIRNIDTYSLRNQIACVFQDNVLFNNTIRENIRLGKINCTEDEIQQALKKAYLEEFVNSLKEGLDTRVGERGVLLSGGQKQRIAIARAILKDAPVVILDEATNALDNKSEAIVQKALDSLMENRTVFVIAHRLSTVQNADRIVVIDQGQIVEVGNHEDLLKIENGAYKSLYEAQFRTVNNLQTI